MSITNIFADHGYSDEEAAVLALRSDVARILREATNGQRQMDAAAKLGISQSDLSKIRNGRIDSLSLERLIKLCVRLGIDCAAQWGESPHWALVVQGGAIELARACADTRIEQISVTGSDDVTGMSFSEAITGVSVWTLGTGPVATAERD